MISNIRERLLKFINSDKDVPVLVGLASGLYPFLFFYSNNYQSNNSWQQLLFYVAISIVCPILFTWISYNIFKRNLFLSKYKTHLLFVILIIVTSTLMSMAMFMLLRKKILLLIYIIAFLASFKLYKQYKGILLILVFMMVIPFFKVIVSIYEDVTYTSWTKQKDDIIAAKFTHTPNIYMIQPDGYVSERAMSAPPYSYKNNFYAWLGDNNFTVYKNFNSNYPASLTSNASMFAMKHHYFNDALFPSLEMPHAREVIMKNDVIEVFKNNGYQTYFIAEDEYFQQNRSESGYDHHNIQQSEIPYFGNGGVVKKDVFTGLSDAIKAQSAAPKFYFIEKVLPHHIHFSAPENRVKAERDEYIKKVEEVNIWLKATIKMIDEKDPDAVIIILADHGGWVGMESFNEFFSTKKEMLVNSTFGNLAAIRWNGGNHSIYDKNLKTNVNVFRVLFSYLSNNTKYLDYLEKDESFNLRHDGYLSNSIYKLIDNGKVVYKKHG